MILELSRTEASELKRALDIYLSEQAFELARTRQREYRHDLVIDQNALEGLRRRLNEHLAAEPPMAAAPG